MRISRPNTNTNPLNSRARIGFVDAINSNYSVKYANRSCKNKAVLCKTMAIENNISQLWIKSTKYIEQDEEIFTDDGNGYKQILANDGGCKYN